jgi:hypothetical protein
MGTDEETRLEQHARRLEGEVEATQAVRIVARLDAEWFDTFHVNQLRAKRDELARRVRSARSALAVWRDRTAKRRRELDAGDENSQPGVTSIVRLTFRIGLAMTSFVLVVEAGTLSAMALALLPVAVLWIGWFLERDE